MSIVDRIYEVVKTIPKGKVMTYKQVAILAGNSKASRVVGYAMKHNPDMKIIPCHRVVGSDGKLIGYSAGEGIKSKKEMLISEGVKFKGDKVILE